MRRYETIIIIDPDVREDERSGLLERVSEQIPQHDGFLVELDDWGQRRMAYEIKKKIRGHYTRFEFCGHGSLVDEMERTFRIDDRVLKYMTVVLEDNADIEAIKEAIELKQRQAEAEKSAQTAAANAQTDISNDTPAPEESQSTKKE